MKYLRFCLFGIFLLSGCSTQPDADIQHFVTAQADLKVAEKLILPPIATFEPVGYTGAQSRSPFSLIYLGRSGVGADQQRIKEPLEYFPLENFVMVGALGRLGVYWGVLRDDTGYTHRVAVGDYIGQKEGIVHHITEDRIEVKEKIEDGQGGWQERLITINMLE